MFARGLLVFVWGILAASCALFDKPATETKTAPEKPAGETFLGTVSSVNENGRFVLVDFGGFSAPLPGSELQVKRAGVPVATLRAGTEMRRPFAAADILQGTPAVGDDIWSKKP